MLYATGLSTPDEHRTSTSPTILFSSCVYHPTAPRSCTLRQPNRQPSSPRLLALGTNSSLCKSRNDRHPTCFVSLRSVQASSREDLHGDGPYTLPLYTAMSEEHCSRNGRCCSRSRKTGRKTPKLSPPASGVQGRTACSSVEQIKKGEEDHEDSHPKRAGPQLFFWHLPNLDVKMRYTRLPTAERHER